MCIITQAVSALQPGISNRYPQIQGKSCGVIAAMAQNKALPKELQVLIATKATEILTTGL